MAGFLELFTRYVDEIGGDPVADAARRVRDRAVGANAAERAEAEERAADIERISQVLFGRETDQ